MQQSPHLLQWDAPNSPKTAPSLSMITPPLITHPSTDELTIPKGIQIQSAVLPQYTFWTDTSAHTHTGRQMS